MGAWVGVSKGVSKGDGVGVLRSDGVCRSPEDVAVASTGKVAVGSGVVSVATGVAVKGGVLVGTAVVGTGVVGMGVTLGTGVFVGRGESL